MIITGGIPPNEEGGFGAKLSTTEEAERHRTITAAVHAADPDVKICMQILHMGSLAPNPACVAPSAVKSRIGSHTPNALTEEGIQQQLDDFAQCARMAQFAGYDGVEIIGSAGYLISTFLVQKTNLRTDRWGGPWENRMRIAVEVVRRVREAAAGMHAGEDWPERSLHRLGLLPPHVAGRCMLGGILLLAWCARHGSSQIRPGTVLAGSLDYSGASSAYDLIRPLKRLGRLVMRVPSLRPLLSTTCRTLS